MNHIRHVLLLLMLCIHSSFQNSVAQQCRQSAIPEQLVILNNTIYGVKTKTPVHIQGINWFGFNNQQTSVDGLWAGGTSFATDFHTIVYKLKLLGFNSVRLPFTFFDLTMKPLTKTKKCHVLPISDIIKRTIDPLQRNSIVPFKKNNIVCPNAYVLQPPESICNTKLLNTTTVERFAQTIDGFLQQGMYVVLDYHPMGTEFQAYNIKAFASEWARLWMRLLERHPHFKGRVILDIMNEPDSMGLGWDKTTKANVTFTDIAHAMMETIYKFDATTLYFLEGTGQVGMRLNWGDGFVTNASLVQKYAIDDASVFFERLSTKPYRNNLVISPHLYGPTISKNHVTSFGKDLHQRLESSFGYLYDKGYCWKDVRGKKPYCMKFPIVIGEFGSFFTDASDIKFFNDVATFLTNKVGQKTNHIGWMFWAYNANSGDTGGIVTPDWQDLMWNKLRWLRNKMGLKPWYS